RILSWGDKIKKAIPVNIMTKIANGEITDNSKYNQVKEDLRKIDLNQMKIGTIDSIADELLRVYRQAGTSQPILIEDFVANSVMINECLLKEDRYKKESLQEYLAEITGKEQKMDEKPKVKNLTLMAKTLIDIKEHIYYNMVDINDILKDIKSHEIGKQLALKLILEYVEILKSQNIYDFAMLETEFLKRLGSDSLKTFLSEIKIILVDEYQDTNLLQESIYFKIARSAIENGGNITVVGDDDQSLYRFRGASVDLFTNFIERIGEIGIEAKEVNLKTNYRSTENIIDLCNDFVELDEEYQSARVKEKPKIEVPKINDEDSSQIPILGMFRNNQEMLANDLAKFIDELNRNGLVKRKIKRVLTKEDNQKFNTDNKTTLINYRDTGFGIAEGEDEIVIELGEDGSAEDIAFLTYSPKELTARGQRTFPFILKKQLGKLRNPIEVFNPRGQDLQNIDCVAVFCGLMLECIDPNSRYQKTNDKLPNSANLNMRLWRRKANSYIKDVNPEPHSPVSLEKFVTHWQIRHPFT
ncbi:MAG: ATP-dependent helicase, partial [Methanobrevibacter sp.]|nr:ATP-dependent helicase [Methanobrevibacter sp.]